MFDWISRATASHNAQLITTAVVSGVVVGSAILGFQSARRMYNVEELKASIPNIDEKHHATRVRNLFELHDFYHHTYRTKDLIVH